MSGHASGAARSQFVPSEAGRWAATPFEISARGTDVVPTSNSFRNELRIRHSRLSGTTSADKERN